MNKLPKLKTDEDLTKFWDKHSFKDYVDDTKDGEIEFIRKNKKTLTVRFDPDDIKLITRIAKEKGLSYTALIRMWVKDMLRKEFQQV